MAPAFAPADLRIDAAALAAIEEAIEGSPFDTLLLRHRADVLWYLGRYEEAIDAYEQAMAANPADSMSIVGRNECLAALGRRTEVRARP